MDIIASFFRRFAKDITVQINPSLITFQREGRIIQSKPTLYISKDIKKPRVLGWGQSYAGKEEYIEINVFDFNRIEVYPHLKPIDCLIAFFRYGIREVADKNTFIRPKIIVHGIYSIESIFPNGAKAIIEKALLESGATECEFK